MFTPYITEKTIDLAKKGVFTLVASNSTEKLSAISQIERLFGVHVHSVRIVNKRPKHRRVGRRVGYSTAMKKVLVALKKGEKIPGFETEEEKTTKKNNKITK